MKASIYRIGDRRLAAEVLDGDFEKQLQAYELKQLADTKGEKLWTGEMPVASKLNEEVTTAFPVDTLLPNLKPGLYVIAASAADEAVKPAGDSDSDSEDYSKKATQWFVVSDLGLTAFSGADGVHVYVRSLASAAAVPNVEIRLIARNNEVLGTVKTNEEGAAAFEAGLSHGTGGLAPALVVARGADNDYGFLDITKQAFDLSDRGVGGRTPPGPLDAMVFTERGVYRPGEKVYVTALLRDAAANAVTGTPLILKLFRPDGVEDRRQALADEGNGGRSWQIALARDRDDGLVAACGLRRSQGLLALRENLPRRGLRPRTAGNEAHRHPAPDLGGGSSASSIFRAATYTARPPPVSASKARSWSLPPAS